MTPRAKAVIYINRLLKIDKNYSPLAVREGDEIYPNGIFTFNISRILEDIADGKLSVEMKEINVREWFKTHFQGSVNEEHLSAVDISRPVIQGEIRPNMFNIIDGNHRITKAYRDGVEMIDSYVLKGEQLVSFFTTKKLRVTHIFSHIMVALDICHDLLLQGS
jgi:hypothetical protein